MTVFFLAVSAVYCFIMIFFQRYDGDVSDLGLTLSYDEEVMGQVSNFCVSQSQFFAGFCVLILSYTHTFASFCLFTASLS